MRHLAVFAMFAGCSFSHGVSGGFDDAPNGGSDAPMIDAFVKLDSGVADMSTTDMMTTLDSDGDGVLDAVDNCPTIANTDQRDHDGDLHGDACDHCPHLASTADPDGDFDGVGDACDPRPSMGGDSRALFEGFYDATSINGWTNNGAGNWSVANGKLTQSSTTKDTQLVIPGNITRAAATVSATVIQLGSGTGFNTPHVSVSSGVGNNQSYWCSVVDEGVNNNKVYASTFYPVNQTNLPNTDWNGTFQAGSVVQETTTLSGSNNICQVVQGGTQAQVSAPIGNAGGQVQLGMRNLSASYDYIFIVSIGN
ncbi:MAG TPA: thrombospondin type 3 repeat-containing protein [Kofleriaceae bacterium]|nr:thrombospondin type 3 repeat-containing protein [Kofleriaceae bacterium]